MNALEFVVIPRIIFTISYIEKELDEESREDFFRLKRVTDNKKIKKAEEFIEQEKRAATNLKLENGDMQEGHETIFEDEDEDIVF